MMIKSACMGRTLLGPKAKRFYASGGDIFAKMNGFAAARIALVLFQIIQVHVGEHGAFRGFCSSALLVSGALFSPSVRGWISLMMLGLLIAGVLFAKLTNPAPIQLPFRVRPDCPVPSGYTDRQ